jgi:hypothetical protein
MKTKEETEDMSMGTEDFTEKVREHLHRLVKSAGLPDTEEAFASLEQGWKEKLESFENQVDENDMELVEDFAADDERGALFMTYSGSLINLGPRGENGRFIGYHSIGIRKDVPESVDAVTTDLAEDVQVDDLATFTNGPIKKSSPIFKIAVITEEMAEEEQEELLADMTQVLTDDFIEVNKTIIQE